jgi:homoserine kinase type II
MKELTKDITDKLEANYSIGQVLKTGKVEGGRMGNNFWIETTDGKYFLREYRMSETDRITEIHNAKSYFYERGIPTVRPIKTKGGETFFVENGKIYALFPFVGGISVKRMELSDDNLAVMGNFLARLHRAGENPPAFFEKKEKVWNKDNFLKKAEAHTRRIKDKSVLDDFDTLALRKLTTQMKLVGKWDESYAATYPFHITHNDFHHENIFFDKSGNIAYIFDWEKAQLATRAKEVARALEINVFEAGFNDDTFRRAKVFLDAYRAVYPLPREEFRDGVKKRYGGLIHSTWIEDEHYDRENFRVDQFLIHDLNRITLYADSMDAFVERLMG